MATWTKAQLSADVLEFLGVKPAGQAASSEDDILCQKKIDAVYERLDVSGLVPFALSAIPEWAQTGLGKMVAFEVGPYFGRPLSPEVSDLGRRELEQQMAGQKQSMPTKALSY